VAEPDAEEEEKRRRRLWALVIAAVLSGLLAGFALTRDTTTEVPNVTGNQLSVAIALLQQNGFSVEDVKRVRREAPANEVLEQDPAASPPANEASLDCDFLTFFCSKPKVTLTVSSGPGSAKVPSTAGLSTEEAEERLEGAGFKAKVETAHSEKVEEGKVIHSEPSGGETATRGTTVVLTVSTGPKLAKVPVLVGAQRSLAVQQIRGRGFNPSVEEETSPTSAGQVIRQAPSAGSQLPAGSTVSIVVSKGEEKTKVPNVIGKLRAEAVETLRAEGLKPTVSEQETEVPSQVGRVTDQFPPPGSELKPGSSVTVVVGQRAASASEPEPEEEEP
jgi:beta-lactam-binding protein with PASTA domain